MPKNYRFSDASWESMMDAYINSNNAAMQVCDSLTKKERQRISSEIITPSKGLIASAHEEPSIGQIIPNDDAHKTMSSTQEADNMECKNIPAVHKLTPRKEKCSEADSEEDEAGLNDSACCEAEPADVSCGASSEEDEADGVDPEDGGLEADEESFDAAEDDELNPDTETALQPFNSKERFQVYEQLYETEDGIAAEYGMTYLEYACALNSGVDMDGIDEIRRQRQLIQQREALQECGFPMLKSPLGDKVFDRSKFTRMSYALAVNGPELMDAKAYMFAGLCAREGTEKAFDYIVKHRISDLVKNMMESYDTNLNSSDAVRTAMIRTREQIEARVIFESLRAEVSSYREVMPRRNAVMEMDETTVNSFFSKVLTKYFTTRVLEISGTEEEEYRSILYKLENGEMVFPWLEFFRLERDERSRFRKDHYLSLESLVQRAYKQNVIELCRKKDMDARSYKTRILQLEKMDRPMPVPELLNIIRDPDAEHYNDEYSNIYTLNDRI